LTHLTASQGALTAGVAVTYEIESKDSFGNIVHNSADRVAYKVMGPSSAGSSATETVSSMVYLSMLHRATFTL
jgi:hypothetical protein